VSIRLPRSGQTQLCLLGLFGPSDNHAAAGPAAEFLEAFAASDASAAEAGDWAAADSGWVRRSAVAVGEGPAATGGRTCCGAAGRHQNRQHRCGCNAAKDSR
jgi:hypothetical protein